MGDIISHGCKPVDEKTRAQACRQKKQGEKINSMHNKLILIFLLLTLPCCNSDRDIVFDHFENVEYKYLYSVISGAGGKINGHFIYIRKLKKIEENQIMKLSLNIEKAIEKNVSNNYNAAKFDYRTLYIVDRFFINGEELEDGDIKYRINFGKNNESLYIKAFNKY